MKKIYCILILCLACFTLQAQELFSYSVDVTVGVGVGRGPLATVTPQFIAQYELGNNFRLGAGVGTRFAVPCVQYITRNGKYERSFCYELDIPVFLRVGYGKGKIYTNVDAGYAIGALSIYGFDWVPGGMKEACYNGFFVEPHIGLKLNPHRALAVGVLLQQSLVSDYVTTVTGTMGDPSYSFTQTVTTKNHFTPAFTLRYIFLL